MNALVTLPLHELVPLAATTEPKLNSEGIVGWVIKFIVPLILLMIGIGIITASRRGRFSENMSVLTNVMVGLIVIGAGGLLTIFASQVASFIFR